MRLVSAQPSISSVSWAEKQAPCSMLKQVPPLAFPVTLLGASRGWCSLPGRGIPLGPITAISGGV